MDTHIVTALFAWKLGFHKRHLFGISKIYNLFMYKIMMVRLKKTITTYSMVVFYWPCKIIYMLYPYMYLGQTCFLQILFFINNCGSKLMTQRTVADIIICVSGVSLRLPEAQIYGKRHPYYSHFQRREHRRVSWVVCLLYTLLLQQSYHSFGVDQWIARTDPYRHLLMCHALMALLPMTEPWGVVLAKSWWAWVWYGLGTSCVVMLLLCRGTGVALWLLPSPEFS